MTDLSRFDTIKASEVGATMEVLDPTDEGETKVLMDEESNEPWTITFSGPDSKAFNKARIKAANARLKKSMNRRSGKVDLNIEDVEYDAVELAVKSTISWKHITLDGEKIECTEDNVRTIYNRFPWLYKQADAFINNVKNFLGN
jgi:hypothetical protein